MSILRKWLGPPSRYQRDIPHTYEARTDALRGQGTTPEIQSTFCETLCGLVEVLGARGFDPDEVEVFAVFHHQTVPLDISMLCDVAGRWMVRPSLCRALEQLYEATGDDRYRGHVEASACRYEDRSRRGIGP